MKKSLRQAVAALCALLMALGPTALLLAPIAALAQTAPPFTFGFVPTPAQWQSYFANKLDYNPGPPNALQYWGAGGQIVSRVMSGDCAFTAGVIGCTKLGGVQPGNLFPLNAGAGTSISGGNLNVTNAVPSNLTLTNPASPATLTVLGSKTITLSNTITFTAVDGSTLGIGAGGTLGPLAYAPASLSASGVLVTDGSSVPSISQTLPSAVQGNITAVGTVASGTWAGTAVGATHGGTGLTGGTSGGVPYFSSATTIASSGALGANLPVFGGGAGAAPIAGTRSGNTTEVATVSGATTSAHAAAWDASGNLVDGGPAPSAPAFVQVGTTQVASNTASLSFTGLGSTYNTYFLDCNGLQPVTNATVFVLQVGTGGTPTYQTSAYHSEGLHVKAGVVTGDDNVITLGMPLSNPNGDVANNANATNDALAVNFWIRNLASTTVYKRMVVDSGYSSTNGGSVRFAGTGVWDNGFGAATAVTALKVFFSSGNILIGQCSLYGLTP